MTNRLKELHEQRMKAVAEMRAITDKAATEKRDLSGEELAKHSELFAEQERAQNQMQAEQRSIDLAREQARGAGDREQEKRGTGDDKPGAPHGTVEYRAAFGAFLARGMGGLTADEVRALSAGVGSQGGYTIMPEQLATDLLLAVDDMVVIRSLATVIRVTQGASLGVVSLDADPADADWTTEVAIGSEDTSMAMGKRKMVPNPMGKLVKVSNDLLRAAGAGKTSVPIEQLLRQRLAYKFAIPQEKAFLTGNGVGQPLGLFTAHADGIPTSRDYSTGNTTTALTFDNLRGVRYQVKDQYRSRARWLFHRTAIERIAKLRADTGAGPGTGEYLWEPNNRVGEPDMLLGNPVISSEYVPNTFTSGLYVGMFGDFSFYWIADEMELQIQRLVELYAATNQTGFIGRLSCDGQPTLAEAFTRIKLA
jgi:HK97 family phage major capsid protein